jgi:hypothetical protein
MFAQGKVAVGDIGIASAAITLSALGRQYNMSIGGCFQQILVSGALETKLLPVASGKFNSVSVHDLFGLQKKYCRKIQISRFPSLKRGISKKEGHVSGSGGKVFN